MEKTFEIPVRQRLEVMESALPGISSELLALQKSDLQIETKLNPFDLVTRADRLSEGRLVSLIRSHFPEDGIVAEEGSQTADEGARSGGFRWVLDPIDGTINYANRLPIWAISIGLVMDREPVGGIVSAPALGLLYRAVKGAGACCNGHPISVNLKSALSEGIVATGFPYDRAKRAEPICQALGNQLRTAGGVRRMGAASLDFCFLADGRFIGYYEMGLMPWDYAAGSLIAAEAGARLTDFDGAELDIFKSAGVVAATPAVHDRLLQEAAPMRRAIAII